MLIYDGIPETPQEVDNSWKPLVRHLNDTFFGRCNLSITSTEESDPTLPIIKAGSAIEVNGQMVLFDDDTDIDMSLYTPDVRNYLCVEEPSCIPYFVSEAPVWDNTKQGRYTASGMRHTGYSMVIDSGLLTSSKEFVDPTIQGKFSNPLTAIERLFVNYHNLTLSPSSTYGSWSMAGLFVIPKGLYTMTFTYDMSQSCEFFLEVFDGTDWHGGCSALVSIMGVGGIYSDGVNYRFRQTLGPSVTIHYRQFSEE